MHSTVILYEHDTTLLHRLDARSKLLGQVAFAVAALFHTSPVALALLTLLALGTLAVARLGPIRVLRSYWMVLLVLALAPLFAMLRFGPPWLDFSAAPGSILAGYQIVLVLFVAAAYVRTTPVRETRAAVQRHVPGRLGPLLGIGMALVFRFFPLLLSDLRRADMALRARAGSDLSRTERAWRLALSGIRRAFDRAETLSFALRARCFSWNPTLPALRFTWLDVPVVVLAGLLVVSVFIL